MGDSSPDSLQGVAAPDATYGVTRRASFAVGAPVEAFCVQRENLTGHKSQLGTVSAMHTPTIIICQPNTTVLRTSDRDTFGGVTDIVGIVTPTITPSQVPVAHAGSGRQTAPRERPPGRFTSRRGSIVGTHPHPLVRPDHRMAQGPRVERTNRSHQQPHQTRQTRRLRIHTIQKLPDPDSSSTQGNPTGTCSPPSHPAEIRSAGKPIDECRDSSATDSLLL